MPLLSAVFLYVYTKDHVTKSIFNGCFVLRALVFCSFVSFVWNFFFISAPNFCFLVRFYQNCLVWHLICWSDHFNKWNCWILTFSSGNLIFIYSIFDWVYEVGFKPIPVINYSSHKFLKIGVKFDEFNFYHSSIFKCNFIPTLPLLCQIHYQWPCVLIRAMNG